MTKQKLSIADVQEQSFVSVLNSSKESHLLGGDWWYCLCSGLKYMYYKEPSTTNIKSASVEM